MENRYPNGQSEHDNVIAYASSRLNKNTHNIYTNPGSHKNVNVGGLYPDIIITNKNDNKVKFIIEVETENSINQAEVAQWKNYISLGGIFYLLVPKSSKKDTINLCLKNNISARFGTYTKNHVGIITSVNYE